MSKKPSRSSPEVRQARRVRSILNERLLPEIKRVGQANMQVYGADMAWKQMNRERIEVAR